MGIRGLESAIARHRQRLGRKMDFAVLSGAQPPDIARLRLVIDEGCLISLLVEQFRSPTDPVVGDAYVNEAPWMFERAMIFFKFLRALGAEFVVVASGVAEPIKREESEQRLVRHAQEGQRLATYGSRAEVQASGARLVCYTGGDAIRLAMATLGVEVVHCLAENDLVVCGEALQRKQRDGFPWYCLARDNDFFILQSPGYVVASGELGLTFSFAAEADGSLWRRATGVTLQIFTTEDTVRALAWHANPDAPETPLPPALLPSLALLCGGDYMQPEELAEAWAGMEGEPRWLTGPCRRPNLAKVVDWLNSHSLKLQRRQGGDWMQGMDSEKKLELNLEVLKGLFPKKKHHPRLRSVLRMYFHDLDPVWVALYGKNSEVSLPADRVRLCLRGRLSHTSLAFLVPRRQLLDHLRDGDLLGWPLHDALESSLPDARRGLEYYPWQSTDLAPLLRAEAVLTGLPGDPLLDTALAAADTESPPLGGRGAAAAPTSPSLLPTNTPDRATHSLEIHGRFCVDKDGVLQRAAHGRMELVLDAYESQCRATASKLLADSWVLRSGVERSSPGARSLEQLWSAAPRLVAEDQQRANAATPPSHEPAALRTSLVRQLTQFLLFPGTTAASPLAAQSLTCAQALLVNAEARARLVCRFLHDSVTFLREEERKTAQVDEVVVSAERYGSSALLAASTRPMASGFDFLLELWSPPDVLPQEVGRTFLNASARTSPSPAREKEEDGWLYLRRAHPGDKSLLLALRWLVAYADLRRGDEQANELLHLKNGWGWSRERVEDMVLLALVTRAALRSCFPGGGVLAQALPHVRAPYSAEADLKAPAWWRFRQEMADVALVREAEARVARMFEKLLVPLNTAAHTCGWWPMQGWSAAVYISAAKRLRELRADGKSRSGLLAEAGELLHTLGADAAFAREQAQWVAMCSEYIYPRAKRTRARNKNPRSKPEKKWTCFICAHPSVITFGSAADYGNHVKGRKHLYRARLEGKKEGGGPAPGRKDDDPLPLPPPPAALPRWLRSMQVKDPKSGYTQANATPDRYAPFLHAREPLPVVDAKSQWKLELLRGQQKPSCDEMWETGRCGSDDFEHSRRFQHRRNPRLECSRVNRRGCRNPARCDYRPPHHAQPLRFLPGPPRRGHRAFSSPSPPPRTPRLCRTLGCAGLAARGRPRCASCERNSVQIGGNEQHLRRPLSDYDA